MSDLQQVLDRSIENASPFTRSLFETQQWDADQVAAFVNTNHNVTISTVTKAGEPHAAVVIAACLDKQIYFTVSPRSLLRRNLDREPRIAFSIADRSNTVMGTGTAVLVARSLDDPGLIERLASATDGGTFTPPGWDGLVNRIEIQRIFAS